MLSTKKKIRSLVRYRIVMPRRMTRRLLSESTFIGSHTDRLSQKV